MGSACAMASFQPYSGIKRSADGYLTRPIFPWYPKGDRCPVGNVLKLTDPVRPSDGDKEPKPKKTKVTDGAGVNSKGGQDEGDGDSTGVQSEDEQE